MDFKEVVDRVIADGRITTSEYQQLLESFNASKIDKELSEQVVRVVTMIENGAVVVE